MAREFKVDLGGGEGEGCTVTITGCDCRSTDFAMALVQFLKTGRNTYLQQDKQKEVKKNPCGCKDAR